MTNPARRLRPFEGTPNVKYNCCEMDVQEIKFGYVWIIKKFSQLQEANGESIKSTTFSESERDLNKWCVIFYPRGQREGLEEYVSLYLKNVSESIEANAAFEFSVLNNNGEKTNIRKSKRRKFSAADDEWGYSHYMERDNIMNESTKLLKNDELTICCEVVITKPENTQSQFFFEDQGCSLLGDDMGRLLNNKNFSDVILVAEDKELHAHKALLGARSPVFNAMFQHDMEENRQHRVVITDISFKILEEMVRFMYTAKLPVEDDTMVMQLLSAADKYALENLKAMCDQKLSVKLTEENVFQFIPLASLQNCNRLKARLIEVMKSPTMNEASTNFAIY